jgi:4-amino-4-deoxy-L-arabinose transferase-like glycosyltransferase
VVNSSPITPHEPRANDRGTLVKPEPALPPAMYAVLVAGALVVLATGLFVPDLVTQDSSRDAVMAMRMHFENDWVNLIKDGHDYLDKPHLLFWSAMAGYRLFGVHEWSYRLISVLVSVLGAWATFGLGRRLYDETVGKMAAVMFITSYAIVLADHDVRMDALLTGFVAFGLWQLVRWLDTGDWRSMALGAAGLGLAFSSKGLIAVAASGSALLFHVWSRDLWRRLWSPHLALGLAVFVLTISPVLYSYYLQFDLHPEKVVDGRTGVSGVKFILLGQSIDRIGGGMGARHADFFFLYHSLILAFLPWSLLTFIGWFDRLRALVRGRWSAFRSQEQLTFLGVFVAIAILSLSRYKLAHYLNVFMPMLAVFTAGYVAEVHRSGRLRWLAALRRTQNVVIAVVLVLALGVLNGWAFPPRNAWVVAGIAAFAVLLVLAFRLPGALEKVWVPSAVAISLVNFAQNANYQAYVGEYQLGADEAVRLLEHDIDWDRIYFVDDFHYPIQFYSRHVIPRVDVPRLGEEAAAHQNVHVLVGDVGRRDLEQAGLAYEVRDEFANCRILKMSPKVLNPRTRPQTCEPVYLLRVRG